MGSIRRVSSVAALAALLGWGCTPFLGPLPPDAATDSSFDGRLPSATDGDPEDRSLDGGGAVPPLVDTGAGQEVPIGGHHADAASEAENDAARDAQNDADATTDSGVPNIDSGHADVPEVAMLLFPTNGLVVQLEADKGLAIAAKTVSKWHDQSGNGFDATESDPAYQPFFIDDVNAGFGAAVFGVGPGEDLFLPDGFADLGSGVSLFFVLSLQKATGIAILLATSPNGPTVNLISDAATSLVNVDYHVGTGTTAPGRVFDFDFESWHLVELVQQGGSAGSGAAFTAYLDGRALVSATQPTPSTEVKSAKIGPMLQDAAMFLQAMLIYSRAVSGDERKEIEQHLMSRWRISP